MAYPPQWSTLAEAGARFVDIGFSESAAEENVRRIVRDGALPGHNPEGRPRIHLDHDDNPLLSYAGPPGPDRWDWLRESPQLDLKVSKILRPVRRLPVFRNHTEETVWLQRQATTCRAIGDDWVWIWSPIRIRTEDLARISAEERADSQPAPGSVLVPKAKTVRRRGRPPIEFNRVKAKMQRQIDENELSVDGHKKDGFGSQFDTSDDTAWRVLTEIRAKAK